MDYRLQLTNNFERAVFLKGDEVHSRETARYQWAKNNLLGTKVLEIGCSSDYGTQFTPDGIDYTGIDYDQTIVDVAKAQDWATISNSFTLTSTNFSLNNTTPSLRLKSSSIWTTGLNLSSDSRNIASDCY